MKKTRSISFLAAITVLASAGLASPAFAGKTGEKTVSNKTGQSFVIAAFDDNARRDKYAVMDPVENRPYWYAQNGSANAGKGETHIPTNKDQWCRVRYIYGDDVRIPECWGGFMYSSHLITGVDGHHYELWFSPSSLSYYKIRNQETGVWYAHDGSANAGRGESGIRTSKEDWCRIIIYHGNNILKVPDECTDTLKKIVAVSAGLASEQEEFAELEAAKKIMGLHDQVKALAGGPKAVASLGLDMAIGYGTEEVKKKLGLNAKDANAGQITAEILGTTAVNTGIATMIMAASGATLNPVSIGVGMLTAAGVAGGEALYKASKDTGIQFYPGYDSNPRYNRDLNGITSVNKPPLPLPGAVNENWVECASENGTCTFEGNRTVRYGANGSYIEKAATNTQECTNTAFGKDPIFGVPKKCYLSKSTGSFKKDGNDGSVSCNTFCGAAKVDDTPLWGDKVGYCVDARYKSSGQSVSCDTAPGVGKNLICSCAPDVKIKHGDNGDASCKTYCANHQSESYRECVSAWNNLTGSIATCNDRPTLGVLKGAELTCTCR